jgi:hypothetical protein
VEEIDDFLKDKQKKNKSVANHHFGKYPGK